LKNEKPEDDNLSEVVKLELMMPDLAYVGDTICVAIEFINTTSEEVFFYEPGFVALIEKVNEFRQGIWITLEEKQLREVSKLLELNESGSLVKRYKFVLDSTDFRRSEEIVFRAVLWSMPPDKKHAPSYIRKGNLRSSGKIINIKKINERLSK